MAGADQVSRAGSPIRPLAGEIQELLDPPRPALAELGLEGLPASGALCRAMERYRHNARLLLEAWEKQPVSC